MSFRFKQFFVNDDRCAMKVGTDGVLLGCWTPITVHRTPYTIHPTPFRVLDIGTDSGLIALMLAQRCPNAQIDAIDIDTSAIERAKENFAQSPFSNQLAAYPSSLQTWPDHPYDLVVSNPPYFQNSLKNPDEGRKQARHTDSLSYQELLSHSARLLNENGHLALILPAEAEEEVCQLAATYSLYLTHITRVYSKDSKPARRVLLCFAKVEIGDRESAIKEDTLVLEDEKGGRSRQYQELCKDFYL